jgi:hypothetical protein
MQPAFEILQLSTAYLMMCAGAGANGTHIHPAASHYKSKVMAKLSVRILNLSFL